MNKLVIIGAGGHGRVIADNALKNGYTNIVFVDDNATGDCMGFAIIGTSSDIEALNDGKTDFIIAIGSNSVRKFVSEKYNVNWVTLIHPTAVIGAGTTIGKGTVVMAGAIINACACVGEHCIINTASIVEHDNFIGDYVHISPRASLGGTVCVESCTHIGIGATVKNNICICKDSTVGAGAVVVKDIDKEGIYVGVPAKRVM